MHKDVLKYDGRGKNPPYPVDGDPQMDDFDYVEIGSLPLAEWLAYWSRGNEVTWDGDLHDVAQLRLELCDASAYVRQLLTEIDQMTEKPNE